MCHNPATDGSVDEIHQQCRGENTDRKGLTGTRYSLHCGDTMSHNVKPVAVVARGKFKTS